MTRNVQFEEESSHNFYMEPKQKHSFVTRLAMKVPGVNSQAKASMLLVIVVALALAYWVALGDQGGGEPTYREDLTPEQREQLPPEILEAIPSRN